MMIMTLMILWPRVSCALDKLFLLSRFCGIAQGNCLFQGNEITVHTNHSPGRCLESTELCILSVRGRMTRYGLGSLAGILFDRWSAYVVR